jgi:hypothetical protein
MLILTTLNRNIEIVPQAGTFIPLGGTFVPACGND